MTPEQRALIHNHFEQLGMECIKDYTITEDDIKSLRDKQVPTGPNAPCFLACVMKKAGIMDDKGMIQKENTLELAKKVFNDDEEIKLIGDYLHSCASVNTDAVSDGDKGCERALKGFKCMVDNASQATTTAEHVETLKAKLVVAGEACIEEFPISGEDIASFKNGEFPVGEQAGCFSACVLRNIGLFDDKGNLHDADNLEKATEIFTEEKEIDTIKELIKTCSKVNEETVTDGEKGCERAKLLFTCFVENSK
ncbi:uncharacterized protein LOC106135657 [Amyelois transitella]|uniref:uncharacterized protein LOC106135657 n=1 Tax=Amyelois transitella TaxID=680683 RepID=UPI00299037AF|nr:uncharacterized protein LOC106135657 [Amyelois transitella]